MPLETGSQHAGTSGFAGTTVSKAVVQPAGLALFGGDEYGRGAASPLLPSLWQTNCFAPVGENRMVELALS
ncbi:PPE family domain protein [Mycobacterium ulcerans str. Harvey]|nr:PPE family domain protein [Mycobacterium ulcerans str. Harvey]